MFVAEASGKDYLVDGGGVLRICRTDMVVIVVDAGDAIEGVVGTVVPEYVLEAGGESLVLAYGRCEVQLCRVLGREVVAY